MTEKFKMVKSRIGTTIGPLPTITFYTEYPEKGFRSWIDNVKTVNTAKKHLRVLLEEYWMVSKDEIDYIVEHAQINRLERPKWDQGEKGKYFPCFYVEIEF